MTGDSYLIRQDTGLQCYRTVGSRSDVEPEIWDSFFWGAWQFWILGLFLGVSVGRGDIVES